MRGGGPFQGMSKVEGALQPSNMRSLSECNLRTQVNTLATGEMDYNHFAAELARNRGRDAIINVNVGTTVKGAVDDLDRILAILESAGFGEDRFYIHVDGALFGLMVRCDRDPQSIILTHLCCPSLASATGTFWLFIKHIFCTCRPCAVALFSIRLHGELI